VKKKKRLYLTGSICAVLVLLCGIIAYAGDYDTPVVPIHTVHSWRLVSKTEPTCTSVGKKYKECRVSTCNATLEEEYGEPLGHMYNCTFEHNENGIELKCKYCEDTVVKSTDDLLGYFNAQRINQEPVRSLTDETSYLDLNGDNTINAKDYSILIKAKSNLD